MKNHLPNKLLRTGLMVALLTLFQTIANAQVTVSLQYTEKNNLTTLPAGNFYTMQLNYAVSSTTGNASGVQAVIHLPDNIIDAFNFVGTTHAPASNFVFDNTPGAKTVTINFIEPVPSGSTGVLEVGLLVNNGVITNGTVVTTTAELTSTGGFTSGVKSNSITITAAPYICTRKIFVGGGGLNNVTTYAIRVTGNDLTYGFLPYGYLNATHITLTDNLPTGTQFVSAQLIDVGSGNPVSTTITQSGGVITAIIPDITAIHVGGSGWASSIYELQIKVKYNTAAGFTNGQTVTNTSTLVFTPLGGSPITVTDGSQVSPNACVNDLNESITLANPTLNAVLTKTRGSDINAFPGQPVSYCINFTNTGNIDLNNVEIIETIPSALRLSSVNFNTTNAIDHFEYQTNLSSTWTPLATIGPGPNPNNTAEYYTKIKIVLVTPFPANSALPGNSNSTCPSFSFLPAAEVTVDTPIQNCAEWNSTTTGIPTSRTACDNSIILKPRPTQSVVAVRTDHAPACSGPYVVGQILDNTLTATADGGGADLENPVLMLFPNPADYFEYVPGSATFIAGTSSLTVTPTFEYIPNYAGTGRFLLRWTFPAGTKLPHGTSMSVRAQVKITSVGTSEHQLQGYVSGSNIGSFNNYNGGGPTTATDVYDLNGDGSTTDILGYQESSYNSCPITVAASASLESIKLVKGQLDADYSRYPASGNTVRGGKADYKLVVRNTGNIPMKNILVIDILPFVGDMGVIDLSPRNTQWRPNLAAPISAPVGVTVYYSTAQNPCRDEMKAASDPSPFPTGCTVPNWSTVPPTDITSVQSLKFDFGSIVLNGADSLLLTWPMRAPVNAPINGEIAWNSFGFVATRTDNNVPLLAAEPIKVGIKLATPAPAYYGDFVWYDVNHNGLQDAGEQGVDGVKVILFKDNGDNVANPATDTEIDFTITGNGGKYLFPNLTPGDYYAVFFPPTSYSVSPPNAGANDAIDSDGTVTTYQGAPAYITTVTHLDALEEDLTWDLGIYCGFTPTIASNSPVIIGGTISLSASGGQTYSWTGPNNFVSSTQNPTIPTATTANSGTYKVTIDNGGCYATLTIQVLVQNCVKPNAGTDVRICAPATSATVIAASGGQTWSAQAGNPASATVTQAGLVSGMTAPGTYKFILSAGTGCTDTVQVIRGQLSLAVTPGTCSTATNQYILSGTVSLTNALAGTLTITDGVLSTTATVTTSTTALSFSLVGQTSGSGSHTVTAALSSCGLVSTTYTAPLSCTVGVALNVTPGLCQSATNGYSISGILSLTNASAGTATITDGPINTTVAVSAGATSVPYALTGLTSGTGSHTVTVSFASKTASLTYTAPISCLVAPVCSISAVATQGLCASATNTFSNTVTVTLTNPTAGTLTVTDGVSSVTFAVPASAGTTTATATFNGIVSNGASHTVTASLPGCSTTTTTYTAPGSCTKPVGTKLTLDKLVDKSRAKIGDVLTYTLVLTNTGTTTATNVVVQDSASTGLRYVAGSASVPAGTTFTQGSPNSTWTVASISAGQSLTLTLQATADSSGILYNKASIPGDTATVCTSIPVKVCTGDTYTFRLTAAPGRSSYKWFRDNVEIVGQTTNVLDVTAPGTYSLAVDNVSGNCPDFSCCPFIVEEDTLPAFTATASPVTCVGNSPQTNGKIILSGYNSAYTYQYSAGATFNEAASLSGVAKVIPVGGVITSTLSNPVVAQAYTIRVYNGSGCYTDVTVMLVPTVCGCPADVCVPFVLSQTKRAKRIGDAR